MVEMSTCALGPGVLIGSEAIDCYQCSSYLCSFMTFMVEAVKVVVVVQGNDRNVVEFRNSAA